MFFDPEDPDLPEGSLSLNIKKFISVAAAIFIAVFTLCSCQKTEMPVESTADADLPELKIGVDILKPFFYIDENGNYAGIDADIAKEACKRAGYRPDFIEVSWSDRDEQLRGGSVDCLWTAFIKNGREDFYQWTDTYLKSNLRAIVDTKSPDQEIRTIPTHTGMAVRAGSKIEELLLAETDRPPISIYSCGTFEMAKTAFIKGYIGALGGHEAVLCEVLKDHPGQYRFLDDSIMTADLGVAFSKNDPTEHWQKINSAISELKNEGTIDKIWENYVFAPSAAKEVSVHAGN